MLEILRQLWENRWVRIATVVFAALIIFLIIFSILQRKDYRDYGPFKTPFSRQEDFSAFQGTAIYSYNGLSFYKLDTNTNQITVLQTGSKLPQPSDVVWAGDKGVLLSFSNSFYGSRVEEALQARGENLNEATQKYTWYLDFSSNELHFVDKYPPRKNISVFNPGNNGIYYVPSVNTYGSGVFVGDEEYEGEVNLNKRVLVLYDTSTHTNKVINDTLDVADISSMFVCGDQKLLCMIAGDAKETTKNTVFSIDMNGRKTTLLENTVARVFPTNNPSLVTVVGDAAESTPDQRAPETERGASEAFLYNLNDKSSRSLGFLVDNTSLITHFEGQHFYVFDTAQFSKPRSNERFYRVGVLDSGGKPSTKQVNITPEDEKENESGTYLSLASHSSIDKTLLSPLEGNLVLFGEVGKTKNIDSLSPKEVSDIVNSCVVNKVPDVQYFNTNNLFRLSFVQSGDWQKNLQAFSACLNEKDKRVLMGYSFQISLLDPVNGRLVSD